MAFSSKTRLERRNAGENATSKLGKLLTNGGKGLTYNASIATFDEVSRPDPSMDILEQLPETFRILRLADSSYLQAAMFLGEVEPLSEGEAYLIISGGDWDELLAERPLAYDMYDESNKALYATVDEKILKLPGNHMPNRTLPKRLVTKAYSKVPPPLEYELVKLRERMLSCVTRAFNFSFFAPFDGNSHPSKKSSQPISISKTLNLLNAFGLGYVTFDESPYDGAKKNAEFLQLDKALRKIEFLASNDDEQVSLAKEQALKADELLDLWDDMSREVRFAIRLDRDELDDAELVSRIVRQYADLIDIEPSVEALAAGVPLEDLKFS